MADKSDKPYRYLSLEELNELGFQVRYNEVGDTQLQIYFTDPENGSRQAWTEIMVLSLVEKGHFSLSRKQTTVLGAHIECTQAELDALKAQHGVELAAKKMHSNGEIRVQLRCPTPEDRTRGGSVMTVVPTGAKPKLQEAHRHPDSKEEYTILHGKIDLFYHTPVDGTGWSELSLIAGSDSTPESFLFDKDLPHNVLVHDDAIFLARRIGGTGERVVCKEFDRFLRKRYSNYA